MAHTYQLVHFDASNCSLGEGPIPEGLFSCTKLEWLDLCQNDQLSGVLSPSIGKLVSLRSFYLWGTNSSGKIPAEIGLLTKMHGLQVHMTPMNMLSVVKTVSG